MEKMEFPREKTYVVLEVRLVCLVWNLCKGSNSIYNWSLLEYILCVLGLVIYVMMFGDFGLML